MGKGGSRDVNHDDSDSIAQVRSENRVPGAGVESFSGRVKDPWDDFAAGYRMGYESGFDVGYGRAEVEMADAWMAEVHRIRALANPDDYMSRVAAAERHSRSTALRLWSDPRAWENAASAGRVPVDLLRTVRGRP
jgi:hypothetical protein